MGVPSASRPEIANAASNLIAKAWVAASPSAIGSNRSVCQGKDTSWDTIVRPLLLMTVSSFRVCSRNATPAPMGARPATTASTRNERRLRRATAATLANLRPPVHGVAP